MKECPVCGVKAQTDNQKNCANCGADFSGASQYNYEVQKLTQDKMSMTWYKVLIYGILFLSAIYSILNAYKYFTGDIYLDAAIKKGIVTTDVEAREYLESIYRRVENLKIFDMVYAACLIGSAVFAIYVRQVLAKFKSNAPTKLTLFLSYNLAITTLYNVALMMSSDGTLETSSSISWMFSIAISIALINANIKYFKNRDLLFCK